MLLNIRGTFGSGKSTLATRLLGSSSASEVLVTDYVLKPTKAEPERRLPRELVGTVSQCGKLMALGSYRAKCGGADEYSWKGAHDAICDAIRKGAQNEIPFFLFEGVTISGIHVRYQDLAHEIFQKTGRPTHKLFLIPPVEVCIERVAARSGRGATDKIRETVTDKWRSVDKVFHKLRDANVPGIVLHKFTSNDEAEIVVRQMMEDSK